ncbi:MAG: 3-dehydroquinate synthase [Deltaproteobacteria bacterium]|nr:MAG: 3-dehydroquinate synthase [Deltaproteobacteria bacterium]
MDKITVNLGKERSYPILVGCGNLGEVGEHTARLKQNVSGVFIVSSPRIYGLYGEPVAKSFKKAGFRHVGTGLFPDGERNKSLNSYSRVIAKLVEFASRSYGANGRGGIIIANLGGGVVGDLGGFVAATFNRGDSSARVDYIQIPTTLLGFVDCGVGGKVGVNFPRGKAVVKNLLGQFYQPRLVYADLDVLKTLPRRELKSGLAEVIKYGIIKDKLLFGYLEKHHRDILSLEPGALRHIVKKSYNIKARVVEQDEKDRKGIRAILNYGHTVGHAIEGANLHYKHGEAIAVGMVCAAEIARELGIFPQEGIKRIEELIKAVRLPVRAKDCRLSDILELLKRDKKVVNGVNRYVLPTEIGRVIVKQGVDNGIIRRVVRKRLE